MQKVTLGKTDLNISVAALGAGGGSRLGQANGASTDESVALVKMALDHGVNLIDTAAVYGTEHIVGQAISGQRDAVILSTKELITQSPKSSELISGHTLRQRIEASLRELKTDYIDILHLHGLELHQYGYALDEFLPVLEEMRTEGKVRYTAASERFAADTTHKLVERVAIDGTFDVVMIGYNFVNHTARRGVLDKLVQNKIGTMCMFAVRGPLARLDTANNLVHKLIASGEIDPVLVDEKNPLGFLLEAGMAETLSEAAYRYCRHTPGIDVVITGTGNRDHLMQNLNAIQMDRLPDEVLDRLNAIFARVESETGDPA